MKCKRFLTLLLALVLVLTVAPMTATADEPPDADVL